jgi:hypothetical protein
LVGRLGFPTIFAASLSILLVLVPLELGYLLYQGRRRNGRLSLAGIVRYREPMPIWQYALFVPLVIFWYYGRGTYPGPRRSRRASSWR